MRLTEIAKARGDADPADTAIALMAQENGRITGVFHNQSEEDLQLALVKPRISVASDGSAVNLTGPTHPKLLRVWEIRSGYVLGSSLQSGPREKRFIRFRGWQPGAS